MDNDNQSKTFLAVIGFLLLAVIVVGLFYLAFSEAGAVSVVLSFAAGLSMIFLPCTLPLAFVIVPLTLGKAPKKGLIMALLFGLGVSITLSIYGILTASVGSFLGVDKATRIMFTIAGLAALLFALSELKLLKLKIPSYEGALPLWIQKTPEYPRALALGLFLGNAGVGCPNPAFYVLLTYIATLGSIGTGWWLAFVHGIGRATPLIFLAILGLLGINSLGWITKRKASVDKLMGWGLVVVGSFIFNFGLMGMAWWDGGLPHDAWNEVIRSISHNLAEAEGHELLVPQGFIVAPPWAGWVSFISIIVLIYLWHRFRKPAPSETIPQESHH